MRTRVGYTGGDTREPTYHNLANHTEALQVDFDDDILTYQALMTMVWSLQDPTQQAWSEQYKYAVWTHSKEQQQVALRTGHDAAQRQGGTLRTLVQAASDFWRAEDYHQKYRLRQSRDLTAELVARQGSDRAMVNSTEAARLNGLLSGYGDAEESRLWLRALDLSEKSREEVLLRLE